MSTWRPIRASCSSILARNPLLRSCRDSAPSQGRQELTSFAEMVQTGSAAFEAGIEGGELTTASAETSRPRTATRTATRTVRPESRNRSGVSVITTHEFPVGNASGLGISRGMRCASVYVKGVQGANTAPTQWPVGTSHHLLRKQWSRLLRVLAWRTALKVSAPRTKLLGHWLIGLGLASEGIFGLTPR